jgi:hypothetical protein
MSINMDKPMQPPMKLGTHENDRYFFDKRGRDRIIMAWLIKNKPQYVSMYKTLLTKRLQYGNMVELLMHVFECGVFFGRISKKQKRVI